MKFKIDPREMDHGNHVGWIYGVTFEKKQLCREIGFHPNPDWPFFSAVLMP